MVLDLGDLEIVHEHGNISRRVGFHGDHIKTFFMHILIYFYNEKKNPVNY